LFSITQYCPCVLDGIDGVMCLDKSESMIQHSVSTSEITGKDNYKTLILNKFWLFEQYINY